MKRTDLAQIAAKHGIKRGQKPTELQRAAMRAEIASKLTEQEIAEARIFGDSGGRPMTLTEAVDVLGTDFIAEITKREAAQRRKENN